MVSDLQIELIKPLITKINFPLHTMIDKKEKKFDRYIDIYKDGGFKWELKNKITHRPNQYTLPDYSRIVTLEPGREYWNYH